MRKSIYKNLGKTKSGCHDKNLRKINSGFNRNWKSGRIKNSKIRERSRACCPVYSQMSSSQAIRERSGACCPSTRLSWADLVVLGHRDDGETRNKDDDLWFGQVVLTWRRRRPLAWEVLGVAEFMAVGGGVHGDGWVFRTWVGEEWRVTWIYLERTRFVRCWSNLQDANSRAHEKITKLQMN